MVNGCPFEAWLSHKSRALEICPTRDAHVIPTTSPVRRINIDGAEAVGGMDNERLSSPTYATATGKSGSVGAMQPVSDLHAPVGELPYDPDEDKVQCHLCGRWFVLIGSSHLLRKHGIDADAYRRIAGLHPRPALATPAYRARRSDHMRRRVESDERIVRAIRKGFAMARSGELQATARERAAQRTTPGARARQLHGQGRRLGLNRSAEFRARREARAQALGFPDLDSYYRRRYVAERVRLADLCAELDASWSAVRGDCGRRVSRCPAKCRGAALARQSRDPALIAAL
jgi:ROS/MUCR transcriptional regulator protein